jgi:hypothetical protein
MYVEVHFEHYVFLHLEYLYITPHVVSEGITRVIDSYCKYLLDIQCAIWWSVYYSVT